MGTNPRLVVAVVTALVLVAGLPLSAVAAERQEVTFGIGFQASFDVAVTPLGDQTVRVDDETIGFLAAGDPFLFAGDAGAVATWVVNTTQNRGAVSGSMSLSSCACAEPFIWRGGFHGRLAPDGASGVLHMTADDDGDGETDLSLNARWETPGPIDATIGGFGGQGILVTGTVTG